MPPQKSSDGMVSAGLGLGKWVVDGGNAVHFCPKYPTDITQSHSIQETLNNSQHAFFSLELDANSNFGIETHDTMVQQHGLDVAERDGSLQYVGSTYSQENDAIYDGTSRKGISVVTFAPILRHKLVPMPQILDLLLDMGEWGMGTPVEIEFAANLFTNDSRLTEFAILQMRPLVIHREPEELKVDAIDQSRILCQSNQVLGNGVIENIRDVVLVDHRLFNRAASQEVANEVALLNARLSAESRPYVLIGVGRWGSLDPWLGIPVTWEQIAGAKVIIEAGFKDIPVTPSQGSHFFQNITSFMVGYFTVNGQGGQGFLDWDWLLSQEPAENLRYAKRIRFDKQLLIKINGHQNKGIILKPEP